MSPRNRVAQLYLQVQGSLLVAFYDSQGYGGGIQPHFHRGVNFLPSWPGVLVIEPQDDPAENAGFNSFYIVVMGSFLAIAQLFLTCLPAVTKKRLLSRHLFRGICLTTGLYATIGYSGHELFLCDQPSTGSDMKP
jgi:hypothetical protein